MHLKSAGSLKHAALWWNSHQTEQCFHCAELSGHVFNPSFTNVLLYRFLSGHCLSLSSQGIKKIPIDSQEKGKKSDTHNNSLFVFHKSSSAETMQKEKLFNNIVGVGQGGREGMSNFGSYLID